MERPIVFWPDKVLQTKTKPVTDFGAPLETLLQEMMDAMVKAEGIGIAANQVGVSLAVAWVGREDGTYFEIINPEVLETSEPLPLEEGCLSVPGQYEKCPRFRKVKVRFQNKKSEWQTLEAEDRLAHVLQHEIDHLNGTVFVNHLSTLKQSLIREKMTRIKKQRKKEE